MATEAPFTVSERAARRVAELIAREGNPNLKFRIAVQGGGCSGFQYDFKLDEEQAPDDVVVEKNGVTVLIDGASLLYMIGSEVDFAEELVGSYFKISNPNAQSSCGCGTSFSV
ncbi:MAG: iron-sulfur cluster insertion protein ErpA [Proteobacteria bacterium]|nr:iron-sulfur cluster insertion protein ErpA [Pseudomonadota bacterium]